MDFFNAAYAGAPPWDIGRPQPAFVTLAQEGVVHGSVLDAGCGTGENALYFASLGHEVWGVDGAPAAIAKAREKAQTRSLDVMFLVHDALALQTLGRTFDTVIDSGLFHVFDDQARACYVTSLAAAVRPGGRYFMMCFSERQPGTEGPRRVTQAEIREAFADGWRVDEIREATFEARFDSGFAPGGAHAWLALLTRI
jgi:SAM-dependent methyltransferase